MSNGVRRTFQNRFRGYSNSRMSSSMAIGVRQGNHVTKRNIAGIEYVRPSWQGTESVFRILPTWNEEAKSWDPCRVSEEEGRYSPWQVCFEAVRNFGEPGITMLLCDGTDPSYDPYHENPCWILYRAIKDACDRKQAKSEWYALLQKSAGRNAVLSRPAEILLAQTIVFRYKSKNTFGQGRPPFGFAPEDPTVVLELSKSAAQAMFAELDKRVEDWEGDPGDPRAFAHPDVTSIEQGGFVHFYQLGFDPREKAQVSAGQGFDPYSQSRASSVMMGGNKNKEDIGYGSFITTTLDGGPVGNDISGSLKGHERKVKAHVKPWEEILQFYTDKEQAHLLNKIFPASAIYYAFNDEHPDWVLDETRDGALSRVRRTVPSAVDQSNTGRTVLPPGDDPFGEPEGEEAEYDSDTLDGSASTFSDEVEQEEPYVTDIAVPDDELPVVAKSPNIPNEAMQGRDVKASLAALEEAKARSQARRRVGKPSNES